MERKKEGKKERKKGSQRGKEKRKGGKEMNQKKKVQVIDQQEPSRQTTSWSTTGTPFKVATNVFKSTNHYRKFYK